LTLALVFGIAAAVAAIPVISRIMMDLRILDSPFGRIVMVVAVVEDAVLYIVLAVVLGLSAVKSADAYGLWSLVGSTATLPTAVYYIATSLAFFGVSLLWGPAFFRWLASARFNVIERHNPTFFRLVFLFAGVLCCVALGVNPIFGALTAGICAARGDADPTDLQAEGRALHAWEAIRHFSLALFVPSYFALVGLKLDLIRDFDLVFFCWFLAFACLVKGASVWVAGRLAGESPVFSTRLAVALNARGTLGVLLASVTLSAGIINEKFFAALVLVSILTCQIAGFWLNRAFRKRRTVVVPAAAVSEVAGGR
jgi:Kef-type K+ transport system membrane component KefB